MDILNQMREFQKQMKEDLNEIKEEQKKLNQKIESCDQKIESCIENCQNFQILFLKEMIQNFQNMLNKISGEKNENDN